MLSRKTIHSAPLKIHMPLTDQYQRAIAAGKQPDPHQVQVLAQFDQLLDACTASKPARGWLLRRKAEPLRGIYLWGGVGRGKTWLMDLFFDALPGKDKQRIHFHFPPTSSSWLNAVEGWFAQLERRSLYRGVFSIVPELNEAIERYIKVHNRETAKPFKWTKDAKSILAAVERAKNALPN